MDDFNKWTEKQEELDMMSDREDQDDEFDFDNDMGEKEDSEEEDDEAAGKQETNYTKATYSLLTLNYLLRCKL